ncbi:hypothetical protein [Allopontixanthobacter sp.]|uniref:hypothetical protein n=1 Tax=Allopontixanthobacter sp. TaxID=2906452 RepID=UPI002AB917F8|nr:hypothetical protein [Allopontixanthobacter sp.]MDZ4307869.1 hypothetical protein [Allopontixanthobacter sp.]
MHLTTRFALPLLALAAHCLPAQALAAQDGGPVIPPANVLAAMCKPQGAMQFAFGQTGVPGSTHAEGMLGRGFAATPAMAPFQRAKPRSTEWSGHFMEMAYSVPITDKDEALAIMDAIGAALEEAGWTKVSFPQDDAPLYLLPISGYATFERPVEAETDQTRILIGLDHQLGELVLTCARDDLLRTHFSEAMGNLPPGTPRPMVPEIALPQVKDAASCSDPAMLAQMEEMLATSEFGDEFLSTMVARSSYRDRLTTWMWWKLEESEKISVEDLLEMMWSSTSEGSPGGNPLAALEMISEMFPILEGVAAAEETRDSQAVCLSLLPFHEWITQVDTITFNQTEAFQSRLSHEAARLGVSLE